MNSDKTGGYHIIYNSVLIHLEQKYPEIAKRWKVDKPNPHILPFALIQKGAYVLKDLFEAICKDEGNCKESAHFKTNQDYMHFLIGETRNPIPNQKEGIQYTKATCLAQNPNNPIYYLSYFQNAIATVIVQLPTLRSIKRFVRGVKSIFGNHFWKCIDQTQILAPNGKTQITLQTYNRMRFHQEDSPKSA